MLPLLAIVAFAALQILAAGLAAELADHAAEAGAVAILEGTDPHDAAKRAIPGWSGSHVDVAVHGKTVRVRHEVACGEWITSWRLPMVT